MFISISFSGSLWSYLEIEIRQAAKIHRSSKNPAAGVRARGLEVRSVQRFAGGAEGRARHARSGEAQRVIFDDRPELDEIRAAVMELCAGFPGAYWRELEPDRYPTEFVNALTANGWLAALIPEEYGGAGLDLTAACVIMEA